MSQEKLETVDDYIDEALFNIRKDRSSAITLLFDIMNAIRDVEKHAKSEAHSQLGEIAGKYLDSLQKSNEQLVKIIGLKGKSSQQQAFAGFDEEDQKKIFDSLQKDDNKK